jgi:hypothetical protein
MRIAIHIKNTSWVGLCRFFWQHFTIVFIQGAKSQGRYILPRLLGTVGLEGDRKRKVLC